VPPVADLEVPDERRRPGEQGDAGGHVGAVLDCGGSGAGADPDLTGAALDAVQPVDAADVDQVPERREAQRQHRDEALTPSEDLGLVAEVGEQAGPPRSPSRAGGSRTGRAS
jgi:hypothetical protein